MLVKFTLSVTFHKPGHRPEMAWVTESQEAEGSSCLVVSKHIKLLVGLLWSTAHFAHLTKASGWRDGQAGDLRSSFHSED